MSKHSLFICLVAVREYLIATGAPHALIEYVKATLEEAGDGVE